MIVGYVRYDGGATRGVSFFNAFTVVTCVVFLCTTEV